VNSLHVPKLILKRITFRSTRVYKAIRRGLPGKTQLRKGRVESGKVKHGGSLNGEAEVVSLQITKHNGRPMLPFNG